ncbi:MAG: porin family protein [Flavobacteriaceae bacterium]|nr:porin family protein [Flavobacteriaceae bacterium]
MKKKTTFILLLFLLFTAVSFSQEQTDEPKKNPILTAKYQFGAGIFFPTKDLQIGVDGSSPNNEIEFGKNLGFDNAEATFFGGFDWRFSKKWKLSAEYFGLRNRGSRILDKDLQWEDFVLKEGSNVKAGLNFNIYRVYIGRIFTHGKKHEFGGGLGFHFMNVRTFVEGDFFVNDVSIGFEKSRKSITIPLPNLGLWYFYTPTSKLALTARVDVFAISINKFSGNLWNLTPGISYQFFDHFGASLNYRYINIGAEFDDTNWTGSVDVIFQGPSLTITGNF